MYIKGGIYKDKTYDYNCFIILNENMQDNKVFVAQIYSINKLSNQKIQNSIHEIFAKNLQDVLFGFDVIKTAVIDKYLNGYIGKISDELYDKLYEEFLYKSDIWKEYIEEKQML